MRYTDRMEQVTVTDQLRQIIETDKRRPSHIAEESGVDKSIISRFLHGSGLTSDNLDKLAAHYGVRLTHTRKGR